jgi:hypothetical protein
MSEAMGQQNRERLAFHHAVRLFQANPALWGEVKKATGPTEVHEFPNGVKLLVEPRLEGRVYFIEGRADDGADRREVVQKIQAGEAAELLRSKLN